MRLISPRILALELLVLSFYTHAQEINFVQYPAGSSAIEPAPNVIISVDDSGSMGESGIELLQNALKSTFAESNIPNNRLRIAWQAMNNDCNTIPKRNCNNGMKFLDSTHRANFLNWVDTLEDSGGTPSHKMLRNAGDYLSRERTSFSNQADWPWAEIPGSKVGNVLACRKSFHIFMTDGSWNSSASNANNHIDADRSQSGYQTITARAAPSSPLTGNLDGTTTTLPDGVVYSPTDPNLRIYKDDWGSKDINTLSDLAFHYWAKDLQPNIPNEVNKITKVENNETITKNGRSVTFTPYWNPKNNPATWQSLTTYTIGFNTATNWNTEPNKTTQLLNWTGDTYSGSFQDIALGNANWPSPLCSLNNRGSIVPNIAGNLVCDGGTVYGTHNSLGNRRTELWHMAINGRGKFVPAETGDDLKKAFNDIVSNIIEDTSQPISSFTSASGSISTQGTVAYISSYDANGWKGGVYSRNVAQGSADLTANPAWGSKSNGDPRTTSDKLDSLTNAQIVSRLILTSTAAGVGTSFEANLLDNEQKNLLLQRKKASASATGTDADFLQKTVGYLRGDRSSEGTNVGNIPFRKRTSRQGDIVNSTLWYTGAPIQGYTYAGYGDFAKRHSSRIPMLYVGGNDGMLHGFSALNGSEKIAYVPRGIFRNLPQLTDPNYEHRYFVDGSVFTGDVNISASSTPDWRTMLVGHLGAGGKGYFVLDVTAPGSMGTNGVASNFGKNNASSLVVLDQTDTTDPDIGHIFSEAVTNEFNSRISAQITRLNNGRWAAVMGNGYNSRNQNAVLLIQYLDGDKSLLKLPISNSTANNTGNGLSAPRLVDLNADGMPDVAYAGDLKGNLWKFDLASASSSNWEVAFNGAALFTAIHTRNSVSTNQPITAAPVVRASRSTGGVMVAFGTGRNLSEGDRTSTSVQSFYSVLDNTLYEIAASGNDKGKLRVSTTSTPSTVANGRADLVARTFQSNEIAGEGDNADQTYWNMDETQASLTYSGTGAKRGWYFDLPESGERIIRNPRFYVAGSNVLEILSDVPAAGGYGLGSAAGESCEPTSTPAKAWRTLLGIEFGARPTQQLLDANGDGLYDTSDLNVNRETASPKELALGGKGEQIRIGVDGIRKGNELDRPTQTINWRQMQ